MIPFGHICIRSKAGGNDRSSRYTHDEQIALLELVGEDEHQSQIQFRREYSVTLR